MNDLNIEFGREMTKLVEEYMKLHALIMSHVHPFFTSNQLEQNSIVIHVENEPTCSYIILFVSNTRGKKIKMGGTHIFP